MITYMHYKYHLNVQIAPHREMGWGSPEQRVERRTSSPVSEVAASFKVMSPSTLCSPPITLLISQVWDGSLDITL